MPDPKTTSRFNPSLPAVFAADDGSIVTDSRDMAAHFGKMHKNVLAKIDKKVNEINRLSFKPGPLFRELKWVDSADGEVDRAYEMDEEAFSLIALSFTGQTALRWQLDYVRCFSLMREERRVGARMTPDQVRAMIREELAMSRAETVRLIKGATWGMTKNQTANLGRDIAEVGIAVYDTKEAIDKAQARTIREISTALNIPFKSGFATKLSNRLRVWCVDKGWPHWRSPETKAYTFPSEAIKEWLATEGKHIIQAKEDRRRADEKAREVADRDARTGQANLFPFPKPAS